MKKTILLCAAAAALAAAGLSIQAGWDDEGPQAEYPYEVPAGLPKPPVPASNPVTHDKVLLGKMLYFDKRLSADGTVSCASCHDPKKGWTDQSPVSTGIKNQKGGRNAPTVLNSAYMERQFWDGRAESLEDQAKGPIENPIEMGFTHKAMIARLEGLASYQPYFEKAFGADSRSSGPSAPLGPNNPLNAGPSLVKVRGGDEVSEGGGKGHLITVDNVARAIAAFERTVLTGNSLYDRFQAGDQWALSKPAQRGLKLFFGKANCSVCHSGPNFSDSDFHNLGVGMDKRAPDLGRYEITKEDRHRGAFKTPTLRNLADTAPYMHDGSQTTLAEVIDFYDRGGESNPWLSSDIKPLKLSADEKADLLEFLDALNGDKVIILEPALPK